MSENSWTTIADLVASALEVDPAGRAAYLDAHCNQSIRAEVESLIAHAADLGPLDRPPLDAARDLPAERFGPYRVIGVLGRGGMGAVYLAERDDGQFQRKVAVKRITGDAGGRDALRRFEGEREILGALSHPNIAHLEDAGIAEDGSPYLVMEHVEGEPLTSYCRTRPLEDRLRLLISVARAVQFAHQNLIVHRDLKPSNILVTSDGTAKLLDFGIAKLLPAAAPDSTVTMMPVLTPAYASPEQICGERVTTSSDVYSLGVLLYEVISDTRPYELTGKSLPEVLRAVCEKEPAPLPKSIPVDLHSVVRKAMARLPEERYGSAGDLARDLQYFLDGRPVNACAPSRGYVLRKFIARHRRSVVAAALVAVLLAASTGYAWWQRQTAIAARQRAERNFQAVRTLANSVLQEFSDKAAAIPGSLELRRLMVQRAMESMDALARDAGNDTGMLTDLATAYMRLGDIQGDPRVPNLGDRDGAAAAYAKALAILEPLSVRLPDREEPSVKLGILLNRMTHLQESYGDAEKTRVIARRANALWESLTRRFPASVIAQSGLAASHFSLSLLNTGAEKARYIDLALGVYQRHMAANPNNWNNVRNVALMHKYLGALYGTLDSEQIRLHLVAAEELDSMRAKANPNDPTAKMDYSFDISMLGTYFRRRREYVKAAEYFEQVVTIRRQILEAEPKDIQARERLAYAVLISGEAQFEDGNRKLARARLREALDQSQAVLATTSNSECKQTAATATTYLRELEAGHPAPPVKY